MARMKSMFYAVVCILAAVLGSAAPLAQDKPVDVTGAWAFEVVTDQGTGTPAVTFKQEGEKLTGTYVSERMGEQALTGSVKGSAVTFSFSGTVEGNTFTVTFSGTVEKDEMKGKVNFADMMEATFKGKKK
jgi:hypothetical protein